MSPLNRLAHTALRPNETFVPLDKAMTDSSSKERAAPQFAWADGLWPFVIQVVAPLCAIGVMVGCVYRIFIGG